jgi:hypothetical protein
MANIEKAAANCPAAENRHVPVCLASSTANRFATCMQQPIEAKSTSSVRPRQGSGLVRISTIFMAEQVLNGASGEAIYLAESGNEQVQ